MWRVLAPVLLGLWLAVGGAMGPGAARAESDGTSPPVVWTDRAADGDVRVHLYFLVVLLLAGALALTVLIVKLDRRRQRRVSE